MSPIEHYPKLRWPLDLSVQAYDNQKILIMRCPLGITSEPLILNASIAPVISRFDGTKTPQAILEIFKEYGLTANILEELITLLDANFMLETSNFFEAQHKIRNAFKENPMRHAALSGSAYAADKDALSIELQEYVKEAPLITPAYTSLVGLMSPHIDYRRGGICYGKTYSALQGAPHDLYILLGTAHQYSRHMFHLTRKHFENPLGTLPCDTDFVDKLSALYGIERSFEDEFLHKREHSLELQIPFISFFRGQPKIVPILVGSFHQMLQDEKSPRDYEVYETFAGALTECLRDRIMQSQKVCIICGVDMAHIGKQFGDSFDLTQTICDETKERDLQYLEALTAQNKEMLFSHIVEDGDKRRICGFPTMYLYLDVMERLGIRCKTELFEYRQAVDTHAQCMVTFAGMGFYL